MPYEAEGKLLKIYPTENKTATFSAREFVIEIPDGNYPQYVKFQAVQDRCNLLDNFREGEKIKVSFDLRGREWQGKYFTSLNAWRIERADGSEASSSSGGQDFAADPFPDYASTPQTQPSSQGQNANFDDLPF